MFKRIDHVEIVTPDLERMLRFFVEILGFKMGDRMRIDRPPLQEIAYVELNGTVAELMSVKNPVPVSSEPWQVSYRMIALEVEDMNKAIEYLKSKGVDISWGPVTVGKSKRAEIKTPDGLSIELRQW